MSWRTRQKLTPTIDITMAAVMAQDMTPALSPAPYDWLATAQQISTLITTFEIAQEATAQYRPPSMHGGIPKSTSAKCQVMYGQHKEAHVCQVLSPHPEESTSIG